MIGAVQRSKEAIEKTALELAQIPRQGFKAKNSELNRYSRQFDDFEMYYGSPEENFSPRVLFVRGIAAHYANKPKEARKYLSEATSINQKVKDENELDFNKRMANSFYYLGLTESNFGHYDEAISNFDKAKPETQKDFLTMIVTAEAYLMNNQYQKAMGLISTIETVWQEDRAKQ